jgi:hypothetical protein
MIEVVQDVLRADALDMHPGGSPRPSVHLGGRGSVEAPVFLDKHLVTSGTPCTDA